MRPRTQRSRFRKQASNPRVGITPPLPQLVAITDIVTFPQPVVSYGPTPGILPLLEPLVPCGIAQGKRDDVAQPGDLSLKFRFDRTTEFLVTPGLFEQPYLFMSLAVSPHISA